MAQMESNSVAIFHSNDVFETGADSTMPFTQHRDIFHLSGVDQEESVLVLAPDHVDPTMREVLFLRETNEHIAVWEGEKLTKEKALEVAGIHTVFWTDSYTSTLPKFMMDAQAVYLNSNEHLRAPNSMEMRQDRLNKALKAQFPHHTYKRSAPIMHAIRSVKHPIEIALMQQACDITEKGVRRVLDFVKPGVWEYEIEAEIMHEFLRNRSRGFAYTPIIASGNNANVLHYIENNQQCRAGDLILMDFGAEYANYSSDLTRTIPVSGTYSDRQKAVYNAVLKVKNDATNILRPGITLDAYHKEVGNMMTSALIDLKLLDKQDVAHEDPAWPAYKKYFMHGTSHYIGLDTHDVGTWNGPIPENSVFTVEPGIYIPEEGFGIRLEDDILLAPDQNINLMQNIPIEADEVEDIMNS